MKISKVVLGLGLVASLPAMAEPYAEWGVIGDGMSLSELAEGMEVPEASEVSIPLAPGGVFVSVSGDLSRCTMEIRTKRSVEEVCEFYRTRLEASEYERVKELELDSEPSCAIYRDGETRRGVGVWVYRNDNPAFVKNGSTKVLVSYHVPAEAQCNP